MWKLPRGCLCFFSILYFFRCSAIFLSFYVTLFVFISFPSTFLSCALLPCPSIICSYPYPFIVPACHVQILTDRIFGMHDLGHHGAHNLCVIIEKKTNIHSYKAFSFVLTFLSCLSLSCQFPVSFLSVSFHFLPCSFYFRQSYLCFTFTLFNFPHLLLFFHVLLMFLWFPFPFVSFSFSSSFHVPFIYSLVTSVSFPFSFKSFHFSCMSCHFSKSYRMSMHIRFKLCSWSLVLFMIFLARLCIEVPIHYVIMCSSFKAV